MGQYRKVHSTELNSISRRKKLFPKLVLLVPNNAKLSNQHLKSTVIRENKVVVALFVINSLKWFGNFNIFDNSTFLKCYSE